MIERQPQPGAILLPNTYRSFGIWCSQRSHGRTVGPNTIVEGVPGTSSPTARWFSAAAMKNASANIGVAAACSFPTGTPVQFDTTANGVTKGITYWIISSSGKTITVGPYTGASAITMKGDTALNVFAVPMPLTFNTPVTPAGLMFFGEGKFILTISDPALAGVCSWAAQRQESVHNAQQRAFRIGRRYDHDGHWIAPDMRSDDNAGLPGCN